MLETEYKELLANVVPGDKLIAETAAKMEADANRQPAYRKRLRTMLIAAVVLAGIIGASAIALTGAHYVDWSGNTVDEHYWQEESQAEKDPKAQYQEQAAWDAIEKAPEGELWAVKFGSDMILSASSKIFYSYTEMESYIRASAPDLLLPATLPEGYDFNFGQILFYLSEDVWKTGVPLASKEPLLTNLTLFKFKLPEDVFQNIQSYCMGFNNKAGDDLQIECRRETLSDYQSFLIEEGGSSEPVTMPGMKVGIFIKDPEYGLANQLNLRKSGMEPKRFYRWFSLPELDWAGNYGLKEPSPRFYQAAKYTLNATVFGKEDLMKIAEGLK